MSKVKVTKFKNLYVITKEGDNDFYTVKGNTIIISTFNFSALIKFLLFRGLLSSKTLQGLIDEYNNIAN